MHISNPLCLLRFSDALLAQQAAGAQSVDPVGFLLLAALVADLPDEAVGERAEEHEADEAKHDADFVAGGGGGDVRFCGRFVGHFFVIGYILFTS